MIRLYCLITALLTLHAAALELKESKEEHFLLYKTMTKLALFYLLIKSNCIFLPKKGARIF